jgi:RNase P subunit RPR2
MYICGNCNKVSLPGEKATKKVTQQRDKVYTYKNADGEESRVPISTKRVRTDNSFRETVTEINVCPRCAEVGVAQ